MTPAYPRDRTTRAFLTLFFCSGLTSLVYETVFIKQLSYLFGGTAYATSTVLASFMGGMAIGSLAFGRLADRVRRPILLYGLMELAIGLYCLVQPSLLEAVEPLYVAAFREGTVSLADATALRALISAFLLLIPSILMGGTLPVVVRHFIRHPQDLGVGIGRVYAINTVGAATGVLLGSYVFLHAFGLTGTVHLMTAVNALIFLGSVWLSRQSTEGAKAEVPASPAGGSAGCSEGQHGPRGLRIVLLSGALLSGFITFLYEVVWVHVLATVVGTSVYAFGLMLFTFLCGLSLGGVLAGRRCTSDEASWRVLVRSQLGAGVAVVCILPLWDKAPWVFTAVGNVIHPGFVTGEITRFVVCFALMIVPTTLLGMTFPAIVYLHGRRFEGLGMRVGQVVATNTVGAIAGSLLAGFVLLPLLGSQGCNILGAALSFTGAIAFMWAGGAAAGSRPRVFGTAAVALTIAFLLPGWNVNWLTLGSNVYFGGSRSGETVEFFSEDLHSGIVTVSRAPVRADCIHGRCPFAVGSACDARDRCTSLCGPDGGCADGGVCQEAICRARVLRTNGKFQGNDSDERMPQAQFAHLPMLLAAAERPRVLVVGLGTGMTPGGFLDYDVERLDIAELSPAIVEATPYFDHINHRISTEARPQVAIDLVDGRNFLLLTDRTYDIISIELTSIWFAGAANLFSRDFYVIAQSRLAPGGVVSNWIQLHHITPEVLRVVVNTAREVFPYVSFWLAGTQGVVVASNEPFRIDAARLERRMRSPAFQSATSTEINGEHLYQLLGNFVFGPEGTDRMREEMQRSGAPMLSTDDNLYLEYATPKGNVRQKDHSGGYLALAAYSPADDRAVVGMLQGADPRMASFIEGALLTQKSKLAIELKLALATARELAERARSALERARVEAPEDMQPYVARLEKELAEQRTSLADPIAAPATP